MKLTRGNLNIVNILVGIIFILLLVIGGYWVYSLFYGEQSDIINVPDIIGYDLYEARDRLKLMGLDLEVVSFSFSDKNVNIILNQDPPAGISIKKGKVIKVVISKGPNPKNSFILPDLSNQNIYNFKANNTIKLNELDLVLKYLYYNTLVFDSNLVLLQFPFANTRINNKDKVSFLISKKIDLNNLSLDYSKYNIEDVWDRIDYFDNVFIEFIKDDFSSDKVILESYIYLNTLILKANLHYNEVPNFKIANVLLKFKYSNDISNVKVYLDDYLGKRLILDSYYVGQSLLNFRASYLGKGEISVFIDNKKVFNYSLP